MGSQRFHAKIRKMSLLPVFTICAGMAVPLHADTLADPDKLLASLRSLVALTPSVTGKGQ